MRTPHIFAAGCSLTPTHLAFPMPLMTNSHVGHGLGTRTQNLLCAYLAAAVLAGLAANTAFGWWWPDPLIALAVATVAVKQERQSWRGEDCC
jgi:hypothetical protein